LEEATRLLRDTSRAVLGRKKLLKRDGLMQPDDDLCVLGEVVLEPESAGPWECSGELFHVEPRA